MIMPAVHRHVVLGIALLSAGCSSLLGSEAGLPVPKDPGTIVVNVRDAGGSPVEDVEVQDARHPEQRRDHLQYRPTDEP
mgnify:CR=1 FL=1